MIHAGVAAFNAGDVDACVALLAPEFVMNLAELPEPIRGRDAWRAGFLLMKEAFPDLQIRIEDLVAAGDRVAARLTLEGTHAGEYLGFPATGRRVSYVSHEFYRVVDGLIAEEWICSESTSLFRQLG